MAVLSITSIGPHDLELSLRVAGSFSPHSFTDAAVLRQAVRIDDTPALLELRQVSRDPATFEIRTDLPERASEVERVARWILFAGLDLSPFYRLAASHPLLGPITRELYGLKPMRPASLFEMLVIAITEQQISLAAAYRIRMRIVERFGDSVDGLWAFPTPGRLSAGSLEELTACGLSLRKAEYVKGLADRVVHGELELERLDTLSDEEVRAVLLQVRGLGPWSVDYFLVRGLSRPDRVPSGDLGIRTAVGRHLGEGERLSPEETMRELSPFTPYRGLTAFYLLARERLSKSRPLPSPAIS